MKQSRTIGPNGEKRPASAAACAQHVFKIMVGELPNDTPKRKAKKPAKTRPEESIPATQNSP